MQSEPFARIEADDEVPLLPAHLVAFEGVAGAFGLRDGERLDVAALIRNTARGVVAGTWRQFPDAVLFDSDHLHDVQVDHGTNAFDWADVAVIVGICAKET